MKPTSYLGAAGEVLVSVYTECLLAAELMLCHGLPSSSAHLPADLPPACTSRLAGQQVLVTQDISYKSSQGPSESREVKYMIFFKKLFSESSFKKLSLWHCVRDKWVKLVIFSTFYCLSVGEEPHGSSFVWWKKIFVPCLLCCWASGSGEGSLWAF